jgi:hypothetical protein
LRVELGGDQKFGGFIIEVEEVVGDEVGAVSELEVAPELFDGIEFGSVGREPFEGEPRVSFQELADGGAFVHRSVVPDDNDPAGQLLQEFAEEGGDPGRVVGAVDERLEVEIAAVSFRRDGQRGDGGEFLAGSGELAEQRTASPRRPGPAAEGCELNAGLVDQHHMGIFIGPFLRRAGHSVCGQAAMRASSRWLARLAGFCGEKPWACSQRQK